MKIGYKILVLVLIVAGFASCNFLDVVPDERTTDTDTYATTGSIICTRVTPTCLTPPIRREDLTSLRVMR